MDMTCARAPIYLSNCRVGREMKSSLCCYYYQTYAHMPRTIQVPQSHLDPSATRSFPSLPKKQKSRKGKKSDHTSSSVDQISLSTRPSAPLTTPGQQIAQEPNRHKLHSSLPHSLTLMMPSASEGQKARVHTDKGGV